jgi:hypothetical protein
LIVVDASALLESVLRRPAAEEVDRRLCDSRQTLHAPHLLDVEVAQVIRRYAATGEIDDNRAGRLSMLSPTFLFAGTRIVSFCRACGTCETISPLRRLAAASGHRARIELV